MTDAKRLRSTEDDDGQRYSADSTVLQAARRVLAWGRGSSLYEWLAAEPEPEVIVIDLRETATVEPFIRLLDTVVDQLQPHWESSTPKRLLDKVVRVGKRATKTRVGQFALELLAPPELPETSRVDDPDETEKPPTDGNKDR